MVIEVENISLNKSVGFVLGFRRCVAGFPKVQPCFPSEYQCPISNKNFTKYSIFDPCLFDIFELLVDDFQHVHVVESFRELFYKHLPIVRMEDAVLGGATFSWRHMKN